MVIFFLFLLSNKSTILTNKITQKTLNDLEFDAVLLSLSEFCISDLGRNAIFQLKPLSNKQKILFELDETNEYLSSFENENRIPNHFFDEITKEIHLLQIEDSFLEGESFLLLSTTSSTVNLLIKFLKKYKDYYPSLFKRIEKIEFTTEIIQNINKIISPFGEVNDNATEELKNIRKGINSIRGKIGSSFTKVLNHYSSSGYLDDIKESVVDNQRVLAVKAMHRKKIKGSILGNSKTGSIVFIAPHSTLQFSRELQNLHYEEQEEVVKILKQLTNDIRPYHFLLITYQKYLIQLDIVSAKAKYAKNTNACLPIISTEKKIYLRDAYHPVLLEKNIKNNSITIPQTLTLDEEQRIIVISGPNAGGKSITLKTIGLLQIMLQSALLIPVHEKSEISFFETILTDIGDNQSIENHLSTYSYRLKNMRNFLRRCNENTLFLIDEFGTGSDPELGGALAEVILENFYEKGAFGVITTHYSNLKVLANELDNMVNANMEFDQKSLNPLFKLTTGQAGSSFTFEVAQKNGIPFSLINRAKKKVDSEKIRLDKTIAKLQKERNVLQESSMFLNKEKKKAQENADKLQEIQEKIQDKVNSFQELYDHNKKMLTYGRKINEFSNKYFQNNNKKELFANFLKWVTIEQAKYEKLKIVNKKKKFKKEISEIENPISKRERKKINQKERSIQKLKKERLDKTEKEVLARVEKIRDQNKKIERRIAAENSDYQFKINDTIRLIDGTAKGTIEKIEKNIATINYGVFTAKTNVDQLELVKSARL